MTAPLLAVTDLSKTFRTGQRSVAALDGVSLTLSRGETLGLVGASGSGKSTLARVITRLVAPDAGAISFAGQDLLRIEGAPLRRLRGQLQMVFQDPLAAFNPRASVRSAIADPLRIHGIVPAAGRLAAITALLDRVGLPSALLSRAIHEISGGQRQRVAIARALATDPALIVLDEAVSALDVSIRNRVLELLVELQRERGIAYLFVSHDIAVVRAMAHRVAIMEQGAIVETGPAGAVVASPASAAGRALVSAIPQLHTSAEARP